MIQLSNTRLLALICFIMSIGVLSSCKKDNDDEKSDKIELLSFGPTGAKHGDTLRFFGRNMKNVSAIQFSGTNAIVNQSDFKQQTEELILLIVPQVAEKGFVTLKTPQGDIVSKTQLNLGVTTMVTSMTLQARPGENITINGNFLNWVKSVTFARDKVVTSFVTKTLNQLVVRVPDDAQTGPLVISYTGTDSSFVETTDTLKVALPRITAMTPNPVKHQTNLTITGTDLDLTTKVIFSGAATPVTTFTKTATQIVVSVPASAKKGKLTLESASGVQTTSAADLDVLLPAVTTISPNPIDPGANLTITGTNLDLVTTVTFENAPAVSTFVSRSATQMVVQVPNGVSRGKVTLGVLNSSLTVQSADVLEINGAVPPPTIAFPLYNDAVTTNWTNSNGYTGGGWGGTKDLVNTSPVREGTKSVKIDYVGGYGSPLQLAHNSGDSLLIGSYTTFKISIFGAPGSGGKRVNIGINGKDAHTITLV
jgi:hypothetical protein